MVVIGVTTTNWNEFDGWCITKGVSPLEMPSRRFFSAAWTWLTEDLEQEDYDKLIASIENAVTETQFAQEKKQKAPLGEEENKESKNFVPMNRWQAPEGWTPPGWDEESAYRNSVAGMMGITSAGGGKIGGDVK